MRPAGQRTDLGPEAPHRPGPTAAGGATTPPSPAPTGHGAVRPGPDEIRLDVPADARFARVARVAVSAAAVRTGLDVTVVEDLRIALDEALILLLRRIPTPKPAPAANPSQATKRVLSLTLWARRGDLVIELQVEPPPPSRPTDVEDVDAEARFDELLPPRVRAERVDPAAGAVHLALR